MSFIRPMFPTLLILTVLAAGLGLNSLYIGRLKTQVELANEKAETARGKQTILESKIDQMAAVNKASSEALQTLVNLRQLDNDTLIALQGVIFTIDSRSRQRDQSLVNLENQNASVKVYLDTPVPVELSRLFPANQTGAGNQGDSGNQGSKNLPASVLAR